LRPPPEFESPESPPEFEAEFRRLDPDFVEAVIPNMLDDSDDSVTASPY